MEKAFKIGDMVKYENRNVLLRVPRIGVITNIKDNNSYEGCHPFIYEIYWMLDEVTSTYFYSEISKVS